MFAITCEGAFYVLRYNREAAEAKLGKVGEDEGIEEAFDVVSEISETCVNAARRGPRLRGAHGSLRVLKPLCVSLLFCAPPGSRRPAGSVTASSTPTRPTASTTTSAARSTPPHTLTSAPSLHALTCWAAPQSLTNAISWGTLQEPVLARVSAVAQPSLPRRQGPQPERTQSLPELHSADQSPPG